MTTAPSIRLAQAAHRDAPSSVWFDGLADATLLIHRCRACDHHSRPDAASCPACQSEDLVWVAARGTGAVVSLIRDHSGEDTLTLGLVELDEGPWLHARLVGSPDVTIGSRVSLTVLAPGGEGGEHVPAFTSARTVGEGIA